CRVASALAAVGDFDGALRCTEGIEHQDMGLGEAALAAAECLDRATARSFVDEAARRLARIAPAEDRSSGSIRLAEAQAIVGDVEGAKKTARSIREGPRHDNRDMTDWPPYALSVIANAQRKAGDVAGAQATLREAEREVQDHNTTRTSEGRLETVARGQV